MMLWLVLGGSLVSMLATGAALGSAMGLTGFIILQFFADGATDMALIGVWNQTYNFTFSAVPMFMLLGDLLVASEISGRVYGSVAPLFQRIPGGLMHSNIAVSTIFGAVSGSSSATSAAVASVAFPELVARGYRPAPVAASLAAGGTVGLLIPPSLSLLVYGAWQEVSIGRLFMAGVLPGLMMTGLFMVYICIDSFRRPQMLPTSEEVVPLGTAIRRLTGIWPAAILIVSVLGSIYLGLATTTEAAGIGVAATILLGFTVGDLTLRRMLDASIASIASFGALSFILLGALILTQSVVVVGLPTKIVELVAALHLSKYQVLLFIVVFYLIMGIFFDGLSLMLTTVPFIYPAMTAVGFDPVWIGVFVTIMIEIGMLTPPIGVNLFVMMAITRQEVSLGDLGWECLPYWIILLVGTGLITIFPDIALYLPNKMYG
jgi:tripartite ATP-independent transporter DctM subunit